MDEEFVKICDLTPKSRRVNVVFKVVSLEAGKNVRSKKDHRPHTVAEAVVGDDTGTILMTVWDEDLEVVDPKKTLSLENGYVSLFRGRMRLNIGKYGDLKAVEDPGFEVNTENDMSETAYEDNRGRRGYAGFGNDSFWPS
jgi:replication factor A1